MTKFPKLGTVVLSAILLLSQAYGQSGSMRAQTYINSYKELAISEMMRTGVPAAITLAQGIIETAGGQSELAENANNHFGIKCNTQWTGDTYSYTDDAKDECFRKYTSVEQSFKDHSDFLANRPRYAFLFKLDPTDYEGWAKGLKKAGYATNPAYAHMLIKTIVENNLQDYTLLAMNRQDNGDDLFASVSNSSPTPVAAETVNTTTITTTKSTTITKTSTTTIVEKASPELPKETLISNASYVTSTAKKNYNYPRNAVFNINEARVIYAEPGTSLLALAANYNVSYSKLLEYNELSETEILHDNQLIFLQKKPRKGATDYHVVQENETLHDIAQMEGVQLASLMELNGLQKVMQPARGERIYLKYPAPVSPKVASSTAVRGSSSM